MLMELRSLPEEPMELDQSLFLKVTTKSRSLLSMATPRTQLFHYFTSKLSLQISSSAILLNKTWLDGDKDQHKDLRLCLLQHLEHSLAEPMIKSEWEELVTINLSLLDLTQEYPLEKMVFSFKYWQGPSQMALEDFAMFRAVPNTVVLYPSDGISAERAVELAANHRGSVYIRTSRPDATVIYDAKTIFNIGTIKF